MGHWIAAVSTKLIKHSAVVAPVTMVLVVALLSTVVAQTMTGPNPPTRVSPPREPAPAEQSSTGRITSCSTYGVGFVHVPGTDACVKIGGFVEMDGTTKIGH
jgi:hypothetical protein